MEMEKWDYEISPGMVEGEIKGNDRGEWIQLWYILRTFANVTMYPKYNNSMIIKKRKEKK
jgi:hypothetical protein